MTIKSLISSLGRLLAIRRDEWWIAAVSAVVSALLNALTIARYFTPFTQLSDNYRRLFVKTFHISGFDPLTYTRLSRHGTQPTTSTVIRCWRSSCIRSTSSTAC